MNKKELEGEIEDYVTEYKEDHYRLAYSYVKNVDDALDIVQESIYKAFSSIDSLKNPQYMKTWFYRILINTSLDFLRKRKKIIIVEEKVITNCNNGKIDTYEDLDLKVALEDLPANYRDIIILRFFEDLKLEEIAEVLNENINTVKTRLYRGLEKLRITME